ncbi:hypothetical protein F5X68DRAFT_208187 [Plectosphaerella plurivora]|uniref:Secreted protein n=1 Tax=Plectosphaerella plurivora TaxID=936078 RepID=A0A9P9A8D4_9PEZI|nr:hypothetical protein F5X68DRAFT_208187 [Plectosphaerella plurivora]
MPASLLKSWLIMSVFAHPMKEGSTRHICLPRIPGEIGATENEKRKRLVSSSFNEAWSSKACVEMRYQPCRDWRQEMMFG